MFLLNQYFRAVDYQKKMPKVTAGNTIKLQSQLVPPLKSARYHPRTTIRASATPVLKTVGAKCPTAETRAGGAAGVSKSRSGANRHQ